MISRNNHIRTIHIGNLLHHIYQKGNLLFRCFNYLIFSRCIISHRIYAIMININQIMLLNQLFCFITFGIHMHKIFS